MDFSP